jgi:hypothetical protein
MLIRVFLGWLCGEPLHCEMVAIPALGGGCTPTKPQLQMMDEVKLLLASEPSETLEPTPLHVVRPIEKQGEAAQQRGLALGPEHVSLVEVAHAALPFSRRSSGARTASAALLRRATADSSCARRLSGISTATLLRRRASARLCVHRGSN